MKDFKILKIKSGSTIQKALSLKNELGENLSLENFEFYSHIRNSKGELLAVASFSPITQYTAYLTFSSEDTKNFIKEGRMIDVLFMDIAVKLLDTDDIIHSETIKLEVNRGITELWN